MKPKHRKDYNCARIENHLQAHRALLVAVSLTVLCGTGIFQFGVLGCQGASTYFVEAESGGIYALVGLPPSLQSQFANHTTLISLEGTFYPSNPAPYIHPNPNYRGLIYVTEYSISGVTYTYAQTAVMISGTATLTSIMTNQVSPTTVILGTTTVTLVPISVAGLLDYSQEICITTLATSSSSSGEGTGNSNLAISGFTSEAVILGLLIGISLVVFVRKKKASTARLL